MVYILILFAYSTYSSPMSIAMHQFNSKNSCIEAGNIATELSRKSEKITFACVAK